ncbi:MAG: tetratricopeptide repeat protein [Reichenbachiella sp.]|uniref:tetratricopeptide repeat protein n=1 Tax=Reichenbachiella sp. TaxID=2184521 RepID=UPI0032632AA6
MHSISRAGLFIVLLFFFLPGFIQPNAMAQSIIGGGELDLSGYKPSFDYEGLDGTSEKQIIGPEDLDGYLSRAVDYLRKDEIELAKADLNYLLKYNDEYGGAFFYRGLCYKALSKIDSAVADFEKVLKLETFQFFGPSHLELGYIRMNFFNDYQKAKDHFYLAHKLNPDDLQVNYALGYAYMQTGEHNKAISYAKRTIELEPTYPESYYLLAESRIMQNLYGKARSAIDQLLAIYPTDERALVFKSLILLYQNQPKKGIDLLKGVLIRNPENTQALFSLGVMYFKKKQYAEGFKKLGASLRLQDLTSREYGISDQLDRQLMMMNAIIYVADEIESYSAEMQELAFIYLSNVDHIPFYLYSPLYRKVWISNEYFPTGLYLLHAIIAERDRARNYLEKDNLRIIERDTSIYHVYRSLGKHYQKGNNFDAADVAFTKMLYLDRDRADGYRLRGTNRAENGKYFKAVQDLNLYLSFNKINADVLETRAGCYLNLGYLDLAAEDYKSAIDVSSGYVKGQSFLNLATIKAHKGDTTAALSLFDRAIELLNSKGVESDGKLPLYQAYNLRGHLKLNRNQLSDALEDFTKSISIDDYFDLSYFNRGITHYRLGNYEEAITDFSKWLTIHPGDPEGLFLRGKAYLAMKNNDQAISDLKRAQNLGVLDAKELLTELGQ